MPLLTRRRNAHVDGASYPRSLGAFGTRREPPAQGCSRPSEKRRDTTPRADARAGLGAPRRTSVDRGRDDESLVELDLADQGQRGLGHLVGFSRVRAGASERHETRR
jgi:hypothetical protein